MKVIAPFRTPTSSGALVILVVQFPRDLGRRMTSSSIKMRATPVARGSVYVTGSIPLRPSSDCRAQLSAIRHCGAQTSRLAVRCGLRPFHAGPAGTASTRSAPMIVSPVSSTSQRREPSLQRPRLFLQGREPCFHQVRPGMSLLDRPCAPGADPLPPQAWQSAPAPPLPETRLPAPAARGGVTHCGAGQHRHCWDREPAPDFASPGMRGSPSVAQRGMAAKATSITHARPGYVA